jgi:hypothetical protein
MLSILSGTICSIAAAGDKRPRFQAATYTVAAAVSCALRLIQPGTALAKKLAAPGCELEGRSRMALRRLHITPGDKPLQVAFLIAGKFGQVALPDVAEQRDLGVRQNVGHFIASGSAPGTICSIASGGKSPPPVLENVRVARLTFTVKRKTLDGGRL